MILQFSELKYLQKKHYPINKLVPVLFTLSIEETMTLLPDLNFLLFLLSSFYEIKTIVVIYNITESMVQWIRRFLLKRTIKTVHVQKKTSTLAAFCDITLKDLLNKGQK